MPCFKRSHSWESSLVGRDGVSRQYQVLLNRERDGCITERYRISVNSQEIPHQLSTNYCSPLCGSGGSYEWEQDGHSFMIMYNNLGLIRAMQGFRLFIDGIDVDTGLHLKAFFRRRGLHFVLSGVLVFAFGVGAILVQHFFVNIMETKKGGFMNLAYAFMGWGAVYMLIGAIPFVRRYAEPRYIH